MTTASSHGEDDRALSLRPRLRALPAPGWAEAGTAAVLAYVSLWGVPQASGTAFLSGASASVLAGFFLVLGLTCALAVLARRALPTTSVLLLGVAVTVHLLVFDTLTVLAAGAGMVAVETCTSRVPRPWSWVLLAAGYLAGGAGLVWLARTGADSDVDVDLAREVAVLAVAWTLMTVVALTGLLRRRSRDRQEQARERVQILMAQRETEQRLVLAEERQRIARDVHDLLGHSLSVIGMQAEGARAVLSTDPGSADAALAVIGSTARRSVDEVRSLIDVLRTDDAQGPGALAPAAGTESQVPAASSEAVTVGPGPGLGTVTETGTDPGPALSDLVALVEGARRSGLPVRLHLDSEDGLSGQVSAVLYRCVQECLTNVISHAGAVATTVSLRAGNDGVELSVDNASGPGGGAAERDRVGTGLVSMRERVQELGGRLEAGPCPEGGWRVHAVVPAAPVGLTVPVRAAASSPSGLVPAEGSQLAAPTRVSQTSSLVPAEGSQR